MATYPPRYAVSQELDAQMRLYPTSSHTHDTIHAHGSNDARRSEVWGSHADNAGLFRARTSAETGVKKTRLRCTKLDKNVHPYHPGHVFPIIPMLDSGKLFEFAWPMHGYMTQGYDSMKSYTWLMFYFTIFMFLPLVCENGCFTEDDALSCFVFGNWCHVPKCMGPKTREGRLKFPRSTAKTKNISQLPSIITIRISASRFVHGSATICSCETFGTKNACINLITINKTKIIVDE